MAAAAVLEQFDSRAAWLDARRTGLGASDAAAVLGLSPWRSPFSLYVDKIGLELDADDTETEAMAWGLALEPLIAERYMRDTGRTLEPAAPWRMHRHPEHPWLLASLDRVIHPGDICRHPTPRPGPGVLEIKTTSAFRADDWSDEPPLHYQVQVQHQLLVTGYQWGSLAVLIGGQKFRWVDIVRNDAFCARLLAHLEAFWQRVQRHDPPPVDASQATREALDVFYAKEAPGVTVTLPAEAELWDAQRQEAAALLDQAKAKKDEADAHLKALLGEAEVGVLPSGVRYSWKTTHRKGYVVEPSDVRVLRRSGGK